MELLDNPKAFRHIMIGPKEAKNDLLFVDPEAKIAQTARLIGPSWILKGAVIEDGVTIGPRAIIGEGVHIKRGPK